MPDTGPDRRPLSPVGFAVVGSEMVGFTVVGLGIDWLTGWTPWATVTLTLLGLVVALLHLARMVSARPAGRQQPPPGPPGGRP